MRQTHKTMNSLFLIALIIASCTAQLGTKFGYDWTPLMAKEDYSILYTTPSNRVTYNVTFNFGKPIASLCQPSGQGGEGSAWCQSWGPTIHERASLGLYETQKISPAVDQSGYKGQGFQLQYDAGSMKRSISVNMVCAPFSGKVNVRKMLSTDHRSQCSLS